MNMGNRFNYIWNYISIGNVKVNHSEIHTHKNAANVLQGKPKVPKQDGTIPS